MFRCIIYILFVFLVYSCAPINKQHGHIVDDLLYAVADLETLDSKNIHKNDVLEALGSPSIKISDVDDVWLYLVSIKQKKVFEKDEINFQQILRYQFDDNGILTEFKIVDHTQYTQIAFSNEKTTITRDAYGISDQIYDAITRGTAQ